MDTTTLLSQENDLPIVVFDMNTKNNLFKVVSGEPIEPQLTSKNTIKMI